MHVDGTLECWGGGGTFEFGQATVPTDNGTPYTDWTNVSAGTFHTCGIHIDGMPSM